MDRFFVFGFRLERAGQVSWFRSSMEFVVLGLIPALAPALSGPTQVLGLGRPSAVAAVTDLRQAQIDFSSQALLSY